MEHRHFEPPFLEYLRATVDRRPMDEQMLINQLLQDIYDAQLAVCDFEIDPLELFDELDQNVLALFQVSRIPIGPRVSTQAALVGWRYPVTEEMWSAVYHVIHGTRDRQAAADHLDPSSAFYPAGSRATALLVRNECDPKMNVGLAFMVHRSMSPFLGLSLLAEAAEYHQRRQSRGDYPTIYSGLEA